MHPSAFVAPLTFLGLCQAQQMFNLDCTNCPEACNNRCYGIYMAGTPDTLNWDVPTADTENQRRKDSGCTQSNGNSACGTNGVPPYNSDPADDTCDEYPQASTKEGGSGSVLRCVPRGDNGSEGAQLTNFYNMPLADGGCGGAACQFVIVIENFDQSPFCEDETMANDGTEFKLENGAYTDAKHRRDVPDLLPHVPDPKDYVPLAQRREFLLSSGKRVLLLSNISNGTYEGKTVATMRGSEKVMQELIGGQKSVRFRP